MNTPIYEPGREIPVVLETDIATTDYRWADVGGD
jgi:hypothetical protein